MYVLNQYSDKNKSKWIKMDSIHPIYSEQYKYKLRFSIIIPVRKINEYLEESIPYIKKLNYDNLSLLEKLSKKL